MRQSLVHQKLWEKHFVLLLDTFCDIRMNQLWLTALPKSKVKPRIMGKKAEKTKKEKEKEKGSK